MRRRFGIIILTFALLLSGLIINQEQNADAEPVPSSTTIIVAQDGTGDYTSIHDAVNMSSDGDIIRVYDGVYSGNIGINRQVTISGNGTSRTKVLSVNAFSAMHSSSPNVRVDNITLENRNMQYAYCFYVSNIYNLTIHDCMMKGDTGLMAYNAERIDLRRNDIDSIRNGISIDYASDNAILVDNTVKNEGPSGISCYAQTSLLRNNRLTDCCFYINLENDFSLYDVDGSNTINDIPIQIHKSVDGMTIDERHSLVILYECSNITIRDMDDNNPFQYYDMYDSHHIRFSNITFRGTQPTIFDGTLLSDMVIENCRMTGSEGLASYIMASNNITIRDSTMTDCGGGFHLYGTYFNVNNCKFSNEHSSLYLSNGNRHTDGYQMNVRNCTFDGGHTAIYSYIPRDSFYENNTIRNSSSTGIDIHMGYDITISGNTIMNTMKAIEGEFQIPYGGEIESEINNNRITGGERGIFGYNFIVKNNLIENIIGNGIQCVGTYDLIFNNTVRNISVSGIWLDRCKEGYLVGNDISNCNVGLSLSDTEGNWIYKNHFYDCNNLISTNGDDRFYKSYPTGGNYWSDYQGSDVKKGSYQDISGSDGFGDTPYSVTTSETDRYPIFIDRTPPVAIPQADVGVFEGEIFHFDGTSSTDDQMVMYYRWEFIDNGETIIRDGGEFDYTFNTPGKVNVSLEVFDFAMNSDITYQEISVWDVDAPHVEHQGDMSIVQDGIARFSAFGSFDDGGISSFAWMFEYDGKDITLYGMNASHQFTIPGIYNITLRVVDHASHFTTSYFILDVIDTEDPLVEIIGNAFIENGGSLQLDGSFSTDNGKIVSYQWSFIEEEILIEYTGSMFDHTFMIPGIFDVTLLVTDEYGNENSKTIRITVTDTVLPIPRITGSRVLLEGESLKLNGLESWDMGGIARYVWTFTDGEEITIEGPYLNHSFQGKGMFDIILTVWDRSDQMNSTNVTVNVMDETPPVADPGDDITIGIGEEVTLSGSLSTDDGFISDYTWKFTYSGEDIVLSGEIVSFRFEIIGEYTIILRATDEYGNWDEDTKTVRVINIGKVFGVCLDEDGQPVAGALVKVTDLNGDDHSTLTMENGSFEIDVPYGKVQYSISKDGFTTISGEMDVEPAKLNELDLSDRNMKKAVEENGSILPLVLIGIVIIIIILFLVVFIVIRRGKKEEKEPSEEEEGLNDMIGGSPEKSELQMALDSINQEVQPPSEEENLEGQEGSDPFQYNEEESTVQDIVLPDQQSPPEETAGSVEIDETLNLEDPAEESLSINDETSKP